MGLIAYALVLLVLWCGMCRAMYGDIDLDSDLYSGMGDPVYEWEVLQRDTFRYYTKLKFLRKELAMKEAEGKPAEREIWPFYAPDQKLYHCSLPYLPIPTEEGEQEIEEEEDPLEVLPYLEPLRETCLYRLEGWWTYEFCFGKHVRQFHQEKDGTMSLQFNLGLFSSTVKGAAEQDYYSQQFVKGTVCDLTTKPRTCEVRYYCNRESEVSVLSSIKEPSSCNYVVRIDTPLLCDHPSYSDVEEETIEKILCFETPVPAYEDIEKEEKELELKKKKEKAAKAEKKLEAKEKTTTSDDPSKSSQSQTHPTTNQNEKTDNAANPTEITKPKTVVLVQGSLDPIDPREELDDYDDDEDDEDDEDIQVFHFKFLEGLTAENFPKNEDEQRKRLEDVKKALKNLWSDLPDLDLEDLNVEEETDRKKEKKEF